LSALVSTIANDGVWIAPRIVAATTEPQKTPQTIAFHSAQEHRVISPLTAAQMKKMMQEVVLGGTGRKAILEGYSSAGKTGTAQKVDPATHTYSRTKYVGSFAGFAPINNPAIVVAVILDSAVGLHQGGQVAAPVFQRISQQVLEYLHVQHDVDLPQARQVLMARREVKEDDLAEASPDHLSAPLDLSDTSVAESSPSPVPPAPSERTSDSARHNGVVNASLQQQEFSPPPAPEPSPPASSEPPPAVSDTRGGTVVLDVEQGGIVVPSFVGKSVRGAIEAAEDSGLDLEAVGSGVGKDQSPSPGVHVMAGTRVTVRFAR
jgi:cell division protein FtsI (penicillin-binding protein 3)